MKLEKEMNQLAEDYQSSGKTQKEYSWKAGIGYAKFKVKPWGFSQEGTGKKRK